jgi:restriction endonuclease S subunit
MLNAILNIEMKLYKLSEIAKVQSGLAFRQGVLEVADGNVALAQLKNLNSEQDELDQQSLIKIQKTSLKAKPLTKGDILLGSRGTFTSNYLAENPVITTIASSTLIIITPNTDLVLSEYLTMVLNSKKIQRQLKALTTNSLLPTLSTSKLTDLKIPIPSKEVQQRAIKIHNNVSKQKSILLRRSQLLEAIDKKLVDIINKGEITI